MKTLSCKSVVCLAALLLPGAVLADDALRVFMLASSCAACHGTGGDSPGSIPSLQGKSKKMIELALKEYKNDESEGTMMNRLAKGYSDEEITLIAEYYATQGK